MKGMIVYKGKYGATRRYAGWLSEKLGLPMFTPDRVNVEQLAGCNFVVIAGSVYIGKLLTRNWLEKNLSVLQNKKLFLCVVCGTPSSEKQKQEGIVKANVPEALLNRSEVFFLPGRLIIQELSWKDRLLLKLGSRLEKDPVKKKAMLQDIDGVKMENLNEAVKAIRTFYGSENVISQTEVLV